MAVNSSGKKLYQLHENSGIWTASPPDHGVWTLLDRNDATKAIAASTADEFCKLHHGGQIFAHSAAGEAWKLIDDSGAAAVVAPGIYLYSWHQDGTIWRYSGTPGVWEQLDTHPETVGVVGNKDGKVWQLRRHRNSQARFLSCERRS